MLEKIMVIKGLRLLEFLFFMEQTCRMISISETSCKKKENGAKCWKYFLDASLQCELNSVERL